MHTFVHSEYRIGCDERYITQNWYLITKSVMSLLLTSRRLCNDDKIDSFPEVQVQKEKENCYIIEKKMERNQGRFDIKFAFFQLSEYNFVQSCIMEKEITFFHKGLQVVMSFAYFRGDLHRANVILKMMLGQLSFLSKRLELFLPDVLYSVSLLYWSKSQVPHVKTITSSFKFYFQNTFSSLFLSILFFFFFIFLRPNQCKTRKQRDSNVKVPLFAWSTRFYIRPQSTKTY